MPDDSRHVPQWMREVQHTDDPNRVRPIQIDPARPLERAAPAARDLPAAPATADTRPPAALARSPGSEPSYYDLSILKAPLWKWEIASYFFMGGLSAGAYMLSRVASRVGGQAYRDIARTGAYTALATLLPCPPLLIHDLGDPKRFHHMLRVWKPSTPMNVGTWTLTAYSGPVIVAALHEWARSRPRRERGAIGKILNPFIVAVQDAAGIPLSLMMMGYTGVLLSCTSNPLWCKNPWLAPMFTASAVSTGAAAVSLALQAGGSAPDSPSIRALDRIDTAAHVAETATMAGFLKHAGERARPITRGRYARQFWAGGAAVVASEVLKLLPLRGRPRRVAHAASSVLSLAAGFSARWALVHAGHDAANDPRLARLATGGQPSADRAAAPTPLPPAAEPPAGPAQGPALP